MSTQPSANAQLERSSQPAPRGHPKNQVHQPALEPPKPTKHERLRENFIRPHGMTEMPGVNQSTIARSERQGSVAARIAQLKDELTSARDSDVATPEVARPRLIEWLYGSPDSNDQHQGLNL